tara:strand:+ start:1392 stop:1580 length:189 start_codon:yes stop_codon:yes gene_type:complete
MAVHRKYKGFPVPFRFPPDENRRGCDIAGKFFWMIGFNTYIEKTPEGFVLVLDHPDTEAGGY